MEQNRYALQSTNNGMVKIGLKQRSLMKQILSRNEQIVYLYRRMLTTHQIAEVLNLCHETVEKALKEELSAEERRSLATQHKERTAQAYTDPHFARKFVEEYISEAQPLFKDLCIKYKVSLNKGRNFLKKYLTKEQRAEQHNQRVAQARFKLNGASGKHSVNYKGECLDKNGYTTLATNSLGFQKRSLTHRVVIAQALGISVEALPKELVVHHIDHNPSNNNLDNLALCTQSAHIKLHQQLAVYEEFMTSK